MLFNPQAVMARCYTHPGGVSVTGTLLVAAADAEMHDYELESRASNPR